MTEEINPIFCVAAVLRENGIACAVFPNAYRSSWYIHCHAFDLHHYIDMLDDEIKYSRYGPLKGGVSDSTGATIVRTYNLADPDSFSKLLEVMMATRCGWEKAKALEAKGWTIVDPPPDEPFVCGDPQVRDPIDGKEYTPYEAEKVQQQREQDHD